MLKDSYKNFNATKFSLDMKQKIKSLSDVLARL